MCRIVGFSLPKNDKDIDLKNNQYMNILLKMRDSMYAGGPDNGGTFSDGKVYFGHRRLSIIDLNDSGNQPMISGCKRWVIVFNGEIYNHNELRSDLINNGITFRSKCDTEVLLQGWIKWGEKFLSRLVGMFAFAIYDKEKQLIYLARDRIGVKPLYYSLNSNTFTFSSETKSFHYHPKFKKKISKNSRNFYFKYGYIDTNSSIYEGISQVKPGSFIVVSIDTNTIIYEGKYWDIAEYFNKPKLNISYNDAQHETENLLREATLFRWSADVPVALFLSGGIDSSTVLSIIRNNTNARITSFTLGVNDRKLDESIEAEKIAKFYNTNHNKIQMNSSDLKLLLPEIFKVWDEPFSDISQIPTLYLIKEVSKTFKAVISADGGDELFYGYDRYSLTYDRYQKLNNIKNSIGDKNFIRLINTAQKIISKNTNIYRRLDIIKTLLQNDLTLDNSYFISQQIFLDSELNILFNDYSNNHSVNQNYNCNNDFDKLILFDYLNYLPGNIMTKVDRATMSMGIEAREPLLDHKLIEFVIQIPTKYKINKKNNKILLRDNLINRGLPLNYISNRKKGFSIPLISWIRRDQEILNEINQTLNRFCINGSEVKKIYINNLINSFKYNNVNFKKIWTIYCWQKWSENWNI